MKTTLSVVALISIKSSVVSPFSQSTSQKIETAISKSWSTLKRPSSTNRCREQNVKRDATASSPANAEYQINTQVPITRISVCAGELCQCQGEKYEYTGGAADAAIKELQSFGLLFPVDEVGCMGACGMGTMIAIDYENGDSIMTDGLESTLEELGIRRQKDQSTFETGNTKIEYTENGAAPVLEKPPLLADVRDRMRREAVGEVENPWIKMAAYLAKKATDKFRS